MDISWLINRVKNILLSPKTEWAVVGAEPHTAKDVVLKYVIFVAGAAAIASFISQSLIGTSMLGMTIRQPIGIGLAIALITFAGAIGVVFLVGLLADVLAPNFGGERNGAQGVKLIAYSATAGWVGAVIGIVPWIGWLIAFASMFYGIYLIYTGAPHTTKVPEDRAAGYTAVVVLVWIVLYFVVGAIVAGVAMAGGAMSALTGGSAMTSSVEVDPDSALGKLEQFGSNMEEAAKQLEAAEKSGDSQAQAEAAQKMLGTLMGGGQPVEAIGTDALKVLVPDALGGLARSSLSAEKTGAMGLQVSQVRARYGEGERTISLEIADSGGAAGLMGLAGWAAVTVEREDDNGWEKTYKDGDRLVMEKWDNGSRYGEYNVVVGDRFVVKLEGNNVEMDDIKSALDDIDLDALAALKDEGVPKG
jgi:hypothetical protein